MLWGPELLTGGTDFGRSSQTLIWATGWGLGNLACGAIFLVGRGQLGRASGEPDLLEEGTLVCVGAGVGGEE